MDEVDAELLAVGDDVDPRILLLLDPDQRRIALAGLQRLAFDRPLGPELFGLGEPIGLGQAAGDGRRKHQAPSLAMSAAIRSNSGSSSEVIGPFSACRFLK